MRLLWLALVLAFAPTSKQPSVAAVQGLVRVPLNLTAWSLIWVVLTFLIWWPLALLLLGLWVGAVSRGVKAISRWVKDEASRPSRAS